jgi:hypothetical protein
MTQSDSVLMELLAGERKPGQAACPVTDIEIDAVERELGIKLPASYRWFLKLCGTGRVGTVDVFGLPRNDLWGDIVLMNQLSDTQTFPRFIKFASDWTGRTYYFDTSGKAPDDDFPVVVLAPPGPAHLVACSFLDFLGKLVQGPISIELKRYAEVE